MRNKISFVTNGKFYSKKLSKVNNIDIFTNLEQIIEKIQEVSKINYFVFQDDKLKISYGYNEFDKVLTAYSIAKNPILKGNKVFKLLHNSEIDYPNGIPYNESMLDSINEYIIDMSDVYPNGEWYDGDTIEDGVPYFEGSVSIACTSLMGRNKWDDVIDFGNKDASDIFESIIFKIIKQDYNHLEDKNIIYNEIDNYLSPLLIGADKVKLCIDIDGEFISLNKKGTGKWYDISEFIEENED